MRLADKVHYVNGPGEVLHAFDAEAAEELSVYAGEEVRPNSQCLAIWGQSCDLPVMRKELQADTAGMHTSLHHSSADGQLCEEASNILRLHYHVPGIAANINGEGDSG